MDEKETVRSKIYRLFRAPEMLNSHVRKNLE